MKKDKITKGITISGVIYASTLLLEVLIQILSLRSSDTTAIFLNLYIASLVIKPISLIVLIIFVCKALSIILKASLILINKNKED